MKRNFLITVVSLFSIVYLSACSGDNVVDSSIDSTTSTTVSSTSSGAESESSSQSESSTDTSSSEETSTSSSSTTSDSVIEQYDVEKFNPLLAISRTRLDLVITAVQGSNVLHSHYRVTPVEAKYKVEFAYEEYNLISTTNSNNQNAISTYKGSYIMNNGVKENILGVDSPLGYQTISLIDFSFHNSSYYNVKEKDNGTTLVGYVSNMKQELGIDGIEYGIFNLYLDSNKIEQLTYSWEKDSIRTTYSYIFSY